VTSSVPGSRVLGEPLPPKYYNIALSCDRSKTGKKWQSAGTFAELAEFKVMRSRSGQGRTAWPGKDQQEAKANMRRASQHGRARIAMYTTAIYDELSQIERDVVEGERRLAEQEALIIEMKRQNQDTAKAEGELERMRMEQRTRDQDRQRLLSRLQP
jgi:hypothetical protein